VIDEQRKKVQPGTDVMIKNIFSPKIWARKNGKKWRKNGKKWQKLAFLTQNKAK
jgi:hypothetical protein